LNVPTVSGTPIWILSSTAVMPSKSKSLSIWFTTFEHTGILQTFQLELMSIESISFTTNVEATWLLFFAKLSLRLLQQPAAILLLLLGHLLYAFWIGNNCSKNRMNEWAYATVPYTLETMSKVQRVKYKQEVSPVQGPSRMP
jgi:hypothetical protein